MSTRRMEERLVRDPDVCGGDLTVRGTRIPARVVSDLLRAGEAEATILREYPSLTADDVQAVRDAMSRGPDTE